MPQDMLGVVGSSPSLHSGSECYNGTQSPYRRQQSARAEWLCQKSLARGR